MQTKRQQLNDYFKEELNELRTSAVEFSKDYPTLAEELALSGGQSRDPHVELLTQSFAWMTSRLRQNMETESAKLPSMLLQQIYPQLISSIPSMAIVQCQVDGFATDFNKGYKLESNRILEPLSNKQIHKPDLQATLSACKFSTCHPIVLMPLQVKDVSKQPINTQPELERHFENAQNLVKISIEETDLGAAYNLPISQPLRFFINLDEHSKFGFYDTLARDCCGIAVINNQGKIIKTLHKDRLKLCGFNDDERLFPASLYQDLSFSILQDFFCFADKFMFFEIDGLQDIKFETSMQIVLIFDKLLPKHIRLNSDSLKLNCVPVINLFEKTTEPMPLHHKHYRYKMFASRERYDSHEIYKVNKVHSVNRNGESRELMPYFCLTAREDLSTGYRWMVQTETSHRKNLPGTESWLSVYNETMIKDAPVGETLYAQTWCCNRNACELFPSGQSFAMIGSAPIREATLLQKPSRYQGTKPNAQQLWKLLSHMSLYYVSLTDPALAQDTLCTMLRLYAKSNDALSQRQIESIEQFSAKPDVYPNKTHGWRGYYQGTRFSLTLYERKFDSSSAILFGQVIYHFLALFCHINAYVRLDLFLGNRRIHTWKPMSGHKVLA
ncbi:MAG: type VI secretion system protein ImpG [Paraglaciecola sp.]|jgi:type VI secretion system protein ImpG